ncbi:hypothetical protein LOZ61_002550 [Ophidiomyces ophidiicola]|uniref:Uncharacterized protein n=1 Tax=Ophidiomyces ophidiicola TaxID=1387563 RepID=A0ACB8UXU3_9EURO|nr:uncharacterized protein LOZ57_002177 [Ophidiomyces ophidiicola]KAI1913895.1 hypothetical protein LOZ61_002550 [Ophidiomyces ophidiicola]KAI1916798.1 hypothetical protein LOZ64_003259 [Ophidiomyces ophidiicola]KAI1927866.1 hypothetical protein LOZ60_002696 [Ophidiomyces ophidiicola]KAI1949702.1 hypothetical protein LOZ57_002177 [Ophidiomyces ophidiicola]KAI2006939.1 hypothetical protein LOZ50_002793 [Ophidiomyces ophidiicola]
MALFFQKRLHCFYCGSRSSKPQKGSTRQWRCSECQAVNHLDENGEITDPPPAEASFQPSQPQYARPLSHAQVDRSSDSSIFCSTCLKNQYLLTETLASYLPPQSHPDYDAYEASYPEYRKSLESRYPQVCERCEPKVIGRIRQAGYAAKADHLRRMMERSRGGRTGRNKGNWRWRSLLVSTGAVSFWASITGQLLWDITGCIPDIGYSLEYQEYAQPSKILSQCFWQGVETYCMSKECAMTLQPYAGLALVLGVFSLWWNPQLRSKVSGRSGRITGVREYYRIQIVALVARFISWVMLQDTSITDLNPNLSRAIHIFIGLFTLFTTIASRASIQFSAKPIVSWNENLDSLTTTNSRTDKDGPRPPLSISQAAAPSLSHDVPRFPITKLAAPRAATPEPYIPPTPPLDPSYDSDAMDWTPSHQQAIQPSFHLSRRKPEPVVVPSPFQGQLPPAPKPPSWQLRNPRPTPLVRPPEKPNPFHTAPILQPTIATSHDSKSLTKSSDMVMAPPKFFPQSDFKAETGLESLFDKAFSIADSPGKGERHSKSKTAESEPVANKPLHLLKSILLVFGLTLWVGSRPLGLPRNTTETVVLSLSFLVAGFSLLELLMKPMVHWRTTDIFLSVAELLGCAYFALTRTGHFEEFTTFDNAGIYFVSFLTGQELFGLRFLFERKEPSVVAQAPIQPENRRPETPPLMSPSLSTSSGERTPTRASFLSKPEPSLRMDHSPAKKQPPRYQPSPALQPLHPNSSTLNRQSTSHPVPKAESTLASFSTITQSQLLSSSFGSTDRFMSPASVTSVSSAEYDTSTISEPPSPILSARHRTPGPSINGLSLEDSPIPMKNIVPTPRYSLRSRRR